MRNSSASTLPDNVLSCRESLASRSLRSHAGQKESNQIATLCPWPSSCRPHMYGLSRDRGGSAGLQLCGEISGPSSSRPSPGCLALSGSLPGSVCDNWQATVCQESRQRVTFGNRAALPGGDRRVAWGHNLITALCCSVCSSILPAMGLGLSGVGRSAAKPSYLAGLHVLVLIALSAWRSLGLSTVQRRPHVHASALGFFLHWLPCRTLGSCSVLTAWFSLGKVHGCS